MKTIEWIKTWGVILGLILATFTFGFESCMTRREITARLDSIDKQLNGIDKRLDRIEDKVERLNQNFIDHLEHHNKK